MQGADKSKICSVLKSYILNEVMKQPDYPLSFDTPLIEGGLIDSFAVVDIASFLEGEFEIKIPDYELEIENIKNINSLAEIVLRAHTGAT